MDGAGAVGQPVLADDQIVDSVAVKVEVATGDALKVGPGGRAKPDKGRLEWVRRGSRLTVVAREDLNTASPRSPCAAGVRRGVIGRVEPDR